MLQVLSELQVTIRERLRRYVNAQAEAIGEGGQRTGSAKSLPAWVGKVPVLVHELIRSYCTPRTCRILVSRDGQVEICDYISTYYCICVLILLCVCPHTTICVLIRLYVSSYYYKCVLILLYVSSYCYMCPHTAICVSSCYCICAAISTNAAYSSSTTT